MKTKKIRFFLLFFLIFLTACQPASFTATPSPEVKLEPAAASTIMPSPSATFMSNASQTKKGVTLTVTNVNPSKSKTIVTFVVRVDPQWGLDIHTFPPQQALHNHSILYDKTGKSYTPISGTYGYPQSDPETGGVKFENTLTFAPLESDTVMFQTEIEITEIPVRQPVAVSLSNHSELDVWSIHPGITFSSFTDLPGDVRILSQSESIVKLEFTFSRAKVGGLQLGCLYFYPENQDKMKGYKDCLIHDQQTISKAEVGLPTNKEMPILLNVSASVMFTEPFVEPWSVMK